MWKEGTICILDEQDKDQCAVCHYWIKVYQYPSKVYGINGGRISKLMIRIDGAVTANYDRGWDVVPTDEPTRRACMLLLQNYN